MTIHTNKEVYYMVHLIIFHGRNNEQMEIQENIRIDVKDVISITD